MILTCINSVQRTQTDKLFDIVDIKKQTYKMILFTCPQNTDIGMKLIS